METLERHIEISELLACYAPLLTPKQAVIMRYYYDDNYTLAEIAELEKISRNAVHDQLKRTTQKLMNYEDKLQLNTLGKTRRHLIEKLKETNDNPDVLKLLEALEKVE